MSACTNCYSTAICGVEVRGVYDGILYWRCETCGFHWARNWSGFGGRQRIADQYVAEGNRLTADRQAKHAKTDVTP